MKRIFLFAMTNMLVLLLVNIIVSVFKLDQHLGSIQMLMVFCLLWGMIGSFISLQFSKYMAKQFMGLQPLSRDNRSYGFVVDMVEEYARAAKIKTPEVYYYESAELNAFATGPSKNNSLVAVSSGLLQSFNRREVEGVLGHEVAHIVNGDMVTMALIQGVVNAFVLFLSRLAAIAIDQFLRSDDEEGGGGLGYFGYIMVSSLLQVVFGILTMPLIAWFSRQREFRADEGGARLAGREKMSAALEALHRRFDLKLVDTSRPELRAMKISGGGVK